MSGGEVCKTQSMIIRQQQIEIGGMRDSGVEEKRTRSKWRLREVQKERRVWRAGMKGAFPHGFRNIEG